MIFYIIKTDSFVKIGVSKNIDNRMSQYKGVLSKKFFNILSSNTELKARYLETFVMEHFKSETEYIYGYDFETVVLFVESIYNENIEILHFKPLGIDMSLTDSGYYDICNVKDYINDIRAKKGKPKIFISDYIKKSSSKSFFDVLKIKENYIPIITKQGKYGGTFAKPLVVIDFLIWSDVSIKYNIMNWMYNNTSDYNNFINKNQTIVKDKDWDIL